MFKIIEWTENVTDDGKNKVVATKPDDLHYYFRLLDDDGLIYAYGYSSSDDDEDAFEPLDALQDDYGVTEIQYYNQSNKTWETL